MESLDQNFYEILEVPADATGQEIERAYRIARATYQPASTATYSIFSDEDNGEILRRVEEAYAVLSDDRLRREYDARLRRERSPQPDRPRAGASVAPPTPAPAPTPEGPRFERPLSAAGSMAIEFDDGDEVEAGLFDGRALRRIRISRGIELEEIAQVTKINEANLEFIEANRYRELPAPVYLRGFLREVARSLKLDPVQVVESYMERYQKRGGSA